MEIGKHIKQYRNALSLSQDDSAAKAYVSRQTISNWENDKSYPDIHSLVLLCNVFDVSLDQLIKGDLPIMKARINEIDQRAFNALGYMFTLLFILVIVTPLPLVHYFGGLGIAVWGVLAFAALIVAYKVEKYKKHFDMQTYREILAFTEGKHLDELEKAREEGKRPYQKILLALAAGIISAVVSTGMYVIFK